MSRVPDFAAWMGLDTQHFRKILVGFVLAAALFAVPKIGRGMLLPDGLSEPAWDSLALFVVVVYFWATEALPLPVTALAAGVGLVLLGVVERPNQAWTPYAQDTIFFLLGSLILADAVTKTDTDKELASRFLRKFGKNTTSLLFSIVAVSAIAAMFVSNHAVAAVMLPLVISILRATGLHRDGKTAAAFILAIALGASIAGLGTPSGGSRNIIILGYLDELYDVQISYLDWMMRAAPITLALIPVTYIVLRLMFRVKKSPIDPEALPQTGGKFMPQQQRVLAIMGLTIVGWIVYGTRFGLGTIAIAGAVMLFILGILDWVDTRKRIAWGVPLIYGAALTMGQQLQDTGAAEWLATMVRGGLSGAGIDLVLLAVLLLAVVLTNIMSDGGTAAVLGPVALGLAALLVPGGGPEQAALLRDMGLVTAIGAAYGFMLVVANPANVITYSSGLFTSKDLARVGLPMTAISIVLTIVAVKVYWPMLG